MVYLVLEGNIDEAHLDKIFNKVNIYPCGNKIIFQNYFIQPIQSQNLRHYSYCCFGQYYKIDIETALGDLDNETNSINKDLIQHAILQTYEVEKDDLLNDAIEWKKIMISLVHHYKKVGIFYGDIQVPFNVEDILVKSKYSVFLNTLETNSFLCLEPYNLMEIKE